MASGLEGSGCHFENILDFSVRNPQTTHRDVSDSVASDISGYLDMDVRKQAFSLTVYPKFSLGALLSFLPKGQGKSRYDGLEVAKFKSKSHSKI